MKIGFNPTLVPQVTITRCQRDHQVMSRIFLGDPGYFLMLPPHDQLEDNMLAKVSQVFVDKILSYTLIIINVIIYNDRYLRLWNIITYTWIHPYNVLVSLIFYLSIQTYIPEIKIKFL